LRNGNIYPMRSPPRIRDFMGAQRQEPVGLTLPKHRINRDLSRRDIQHQPQSSPGSHFDRQRQGLFGRPVESQRRVKPIERPMHEDVAAAAWLEWRSQANVTESHGGDAREACGPACKRPGDQGMEVVNAYTYPAAVD
jgi:hypothetical protein